MAIIRCNKCTLLAEQPDKLAGQSLPCPQCGAPAAVYSTLFFIEKLLDKYFDAQRQVIRLKSAASAARSDEPETAPPLRRKPMSIWPTPIIWRQNCSTGRSTTGSTRSRSRSRPTCSASTPAAFSTKWPKPSAAISMCSRRCSNGFAGRSRRNTLANGDPCELDVFMLIDGKLPICIECKSGEFRQNIDRYLALRKRLGLEARQFVMCITGLSDENAKAFSAMYDLTFVSERSLAGHLGRLF